MVKLMQLFLDTLRQGGPSYAVEPADKGFLIVRREGHDDAFNRIARQVRDESGVHYSAFLRPDGRGGYDCVHIVPHD